MLRVELNGERGDGTCLIMQWFERVEAKRPPDFIIGGDTPYMLRWWLIPRNRFFNIYLHKILRSDDDRALHDHPWLNLSVLLKGEYTEHMILAGGVERAIRYGAGNVRFRRAKTAHRLVVTEPCWSLFITGPVIRTWGFHCPKGWRPWHQFVSQRDKGAVGLGCD